MVLNSALVRARCRAVANRVKPRRACAMQEVVQGNSAIVAPDLVPGIRILNQRGFRPWPATLAIARTVMLSYSHSIFPTAGGEMGRALLGGTTTRRICCRFAADCKFGRKQHNFRLHPGARRRRALVKPRLHTNAVCRWLVAKRVKSGKTGRLYLPANDPEG